MKRFALLFALFFAFALSAQAATHSINLSWGASADSTTANPGTVTVLQAAGQCPGTGIPTGATVLTSTAPAGGPYTESGVAPGSYCIYVTATIGGRTSGPSNTTEPDVNPFPPTGLTIVVQ